LTPQLTSADIEKMRQIVLESDKKASANEFDLNKPPSANYVHQPWPKLTYGIDRDGKATYRKVHDAEEHDAAIAAGWANEPVAPPESNEFPLEGAASNEAAAVDQQIAANKAKAKKNGR
jgi:hypothetical protein